MITRRLSFVGVSATAILSLAGCAHRWERPVQADGTHCFAVSKSRNSTCTDAPVPTAVADLEAKRFLPDPNALTVYVVRHRWADARNQVPVSVDDGAAVLTVPESMVRYRLSPGTHKVSLAWGDKAATQTIEGRSGEVRFVQLVGSVWSWGSQYQLEAGDTTEARLRGQKSRLVADIDAR